jgi:hypothetical protein
MKAYENGEELVLYEHEVVEESQPVASLIELAFDDADAVVSHASYSPFGLKVEQLAQIARDDAIVDRLRPAVLVAEQE